MEPRKSSKFPIRDSRAKVGSSEQAGGCRDAPLACLSTSKDIVSLASGFHSLAYFDTAAGFRAVAHRDQHRANPRFSHGKWRRVSGTVRHHLARKGPHNVTMYRPRSFVDRARCRICFLVGILCYTHLLFANGWAATERTVARCSDSKLKGLTRSVLEASEKGSAREVARLFRLIRYCRRTELLNEQMIVGLLPVANSELRTELYSLIRAGHFVSAIPNLERLLSSEQRIDVAWRPGTSKLLTSLRAVCEYPEPIVDHANCEEERAPLFTPVLQPKPPQSLDLSLFKGLSKVLFDRKPVIYLYPAKEQNVSVKLDYQGVLTATYPAYDPVTGWRVKARPDGSLTEIASQQEYSYLFWEGRPRKPLTIPEGQGFLVRGEDTAHFLRKKLSALGLMPKEYNEFIVYWYPLMKENKFNQIYFAGAEYIESAPLEVDPQPDTTLRVFMLYRALSAPVELKAQPIPTTVRQGFTLVEWGGTEIPSQ